MRLLSIDQLYPHPNNPRKDVGDITELADSMKAKGIFQNLTVVEGGAGVPEGKNGYTIIIGHRRHAAAKKAGITKLPCSIVEMDEHEQIETMLLENMQRTDLTVYEQAQGFQMMLDMGETEASIAEKTGFSKTTVRHRVKLLELNQEEFEKSQERGASITDYIALEKIPDIGERNKVLKYIGTSNFNWSVQYAITACKRKAAHNAWNKIFKEYGLKKDPESAANKKENIFEGRYVGYDEAPSKPQIAQIRKAVKEGKALSYTIRYSCIYILGADKPKDKKPKDPEEAALAAKIKNIKELEIQAKKLRTAFVKNYNGGNITILLQAAFKCNVSLFVYGSREKSLKEYLSTTDKDKKASVINTAYYCYLLKRHPEVLLLAYIAVEYENMSIVLHDNLGNYQRSTKLEEWYKLLENIGYKMSDDEKSLLDGSHKCFKEEE